MGIWTFEASPATRAKIVAEFKRTIRDPKEAEAASKKFEEGLSHMTLQITGDAMVTRQDDKEVGKERYEVVSEDKDRITVRMVVSRKQQVLVFKDDRTVDLHDDKMGQVLLHKR